MEVSEIMVTDVVVINKGFTVMEGVDLMIKYGVNCVLVLDDKSAAGIITETDILRKVVAAKKDANLLKVEDIMTHPLITVPPATALEEAAALMTKNKIKKLPVVDGERLVGLLTAQDIIAAEPRHIKDFAELILKPTKVVGG